MEDICINISNDSMSKGLVKDKQLIAWDCIQLCDPMSCPIGNTCTYKSTPKCSVQLSYLNALTDMVFKTFRYLNDDSLFKIGMHLIPLYSQLCRQKIVEKSVINICYEDSKGVTRIHPIYKEIRETMKTISCMWKELGLCGNIDPGLPNDRGFGDNQHYSTISQNADNKRDVIR
jgi:hypothetical protein